MVKKNGKKKFSSGAQPSLSFVERLKWLVSRGVFVFLGFILALILLFSFVNPPTNIYQFQESWRLGGAHQEWVSPEEIAPVVARSVVAAEDANFCRHWGFDVEAIRGVIKKGSARGASTITQQVVKNVFLWQGRSWPRKAAEALLTPVVEVFWSKRRILEVYLNVAEFDEGVFGVEAAAEHYFKSSADKLSAGQSALLAAILPEPKGRSASKPSSFVKKRAKAIISGANTIAADGRDKCFIY